MPKRKRSPKWGRLGKWVKYHSRVVCIFCDSKFCSRLELKPHDQFLRCLIRMSSVPDKLQKKFPFLHFYPQKPHLGASVGIFKRNALITGTASIPSKFCSTIETTKYSSWVVQTSNTLATNPKWRTAATVHTGCVNVRELEFSSVRSLCCAGPDLSVWRPWAGSLLEAPTHLQML